MKKQFSLCFVLLLLMFSSLVSAQEPINLSNAKQQVITYYQKGQYLREINHIMLSAKNYLQKRIAINADRQQPQKLAIVLDIDETSLSNYINLLAVDFSCLPTQIDEFLKKGEAKPLMATKALFDYATKNHVSVFFVTGRRAFLADATVKNLKAAKYTYWAGLFLKPNKYNASSVSPYKIEMRKKITSEGYIIVENIGDQESDLIGGYAERTFKLPNPFYLIN